MAKRKADPKKPSQVENPTTPFELKSPDVDVTVPKESAGPFNHPDAIFPNGTHFGIIQMERDRLPKPEAQRIVQWVNRNGALQCYVTENAYHRSECITWYDKLVRMSYQNSLSHGSPCLHPVKGRIHWLRFTGNFCKTGKGERINPETDKPEEAE